MARSSAISISRRPRTTNQEVASRVAQHLGPMSSAEAIRTVHTVIERYPPEVGDCFGLGMELGRRKSQVVWTARNELLCWWLTPPETYIERRRQFDDIRERVRRLVVVRSVKASFYGESIQAGFINKRTHDVTDLRGERWRISFYPGIRTRVPSPAGVLAGADHRQPKD